MSGLAGRRRILAIVVTVALGAGALAGAATPASAYGKTSAVGVRAADGARIVSQTRVSDRMVDITIDSPALGRKGKVRLILPPHWSSQSDTTWPSLYLLHGSSESADYASWTSFTDVESFMADKNVLVVMPTGGLAGMYSDSWDYGMHNGPQYETFHTQEIPELMTKAFRADDRRVVAGLSTGGLGAVGYTERHPGLFSAVASYSGFLDTSMPGGPAFVLAIKTRANEDAVALWGSPLLQDDIWSQHNPSEHVDKLRGVPVYVSSGNGTPGPFDRRGSTFDAIEAMALTAAQSFILNARRAGVHVESHLYLGGTHTWPYWQHELHHSWPMLAAALR